MAIKREKTNRTETIGVRMPPKLRYALELVAQKSSETLSQLMVRALNEYLDKEGITSKKAGESLTTLDMLWSESESERAFKIIGSGYETINDIEVVNVINDLEEKIKNSGCQMNKKEFFVYCDKYMDVVHAVVDGNVSNMELYKKAVDALGEE